MGYNRMFAVNYARNFWNRVCHDGRVAMSGYPRKINGVTLTPGLPFSAIGKISGELDCTHFLSCCIGQTATFKVDHRSEEGLYEEFLQDPDSVVGGGLNIPSPLANLGVYGHVTTSALVWCLTHTQGAKIILNPGMPAKDDSNWFWNKWYTSTGDAIRKNLTAGDVLAYADRADTNAYAHMALLLGPDGRIACHTIHRCGQPYTAVIQHPWVTLIKLP